MWNDNIYNPVYIWFKNVSGAIGSQVDGAKLKCKRPSRHIVIRSLKPLADVVRDAFDHTSFVV